MQLDKVQGHFQHENFRDGIRSSRISYRFNMSRSIAMECIRWILIRYRGILSKSIGSYGSRWSQIRYRGILSRRMVIDKGSDSTRFKVIFSRRIGIGACGGGCIRFKDNTRRRIGRDGSGSY